MKQIIFLVTIISFALQAAEYEVNVKIKETEDKLETRIEKALEKIEGKTEGQNTKSTPKTEEDATSIEEAEKVEEESSFTDTQKNSQRTLVIAEGVEGNFSIYTEEGILLSKRYKKEEDILRVNLLEGVYSVILENDFGVFSSAVNLKDNKAVLTKEKFIKTASINKEAKLEEKTNEEEVNASPAEENASNIQQEYFSHAYIPETVEENMKDRNFSFSIFMPSGNLNGFGLGIIGNNVGKNLKGAQVSIGFNTVGEEMAGSQVAVGFNTASKANGAQTAVGFNVCNGVMAGAQTAVGFNASKEMLYGAQTAVGLNTAQNVVGAQTAVGANIAKASVKGAQTAIGFNSAESIDGIQTAVGLNVGKTVRGTQIGFINTSREIKGVQIGLINIAKSSTVSIGLLNFVADGFHLTTIYDSMGFVNLEANSGSKYFYNVFGAGVQDSLDWGKVTLGAGIHIPIIRKEKKKDEDGEKRDIFYVNTELTFSHIGPIRQEKHFFYSHENLLATAKVYAGFSPFGKFSVVAGLAYNGFAQTGENRVSLITAGVEQFASKFIETYTYDNFHHKGTTGVVEIITYPSVFMGVRF